MYNDVQYELDQACKRLQSLIERGADEWTISQARKEVQRLTQRAKKVVQKSPRKRLDSRGDDW